MFKHTEGPVEVRRPETIDIHQDLLSLSDIQDGLSDRRLIVVAERTGISYTTLKKLFDGAKNNYNTNTLYDVSYYLKNGEAPPR